MRLVISFLVDFSYNRIWITLDDMALFITNSVMKKLITIVKKSDKRTENAIRRPHPIGRIDSAPIFIHNRAARLPECTKTRNSS